MPEPRKHRLVKMVLSEISLVDLPAEPNSLISIFKRGESAPPEESSVTDQERIADEMKKAGDRISALTTDVATLTAANTKLTADLEASQARVTAVAKAKADGDSDEDAILKSASPEVAAEIIKLRASNKASTDALAKIAEESEIAKMVTVVKNEFGNLPMKAETFGPIMKRVAGLMTEDDFTELRRVLKAADALAQEATQIRGFGREITPTSAEAELQKAAEAIQATDSIPFTKAYERAVQRNPQLYARYQAERSVN